MYVFSGIYTFTLTMNMLSSGLGVVLKMDGESVSAMGFVENEGNLVIHNTVRCNTNQRVYAEVVLADGISLIKCSYRNIPLMSFTGKLDFSIP